MQTNTNKGTAQKKQSIKPLHVVVDRDML